MAKGSVNISGMSEEDIESCISTHDESHDAHSDIRITVSRGLSGTGGYIEAVSGAFQ